MIKALYIKNFALIDELDIRLEDGFSVITGETGAGKSIILGALDLLAGGRWQVAGGEGKTIVEVEFGDEQILRREINHESGRSRAFIDDSPVTLAELKTECDKRIDIHSQHQNLLLKDSDYQLNVVDKMGGDAKLLNEFKSVYEEYKTKGLEFKNKREELDAARAQEDYLQFQYNELKALQLADEGELETLEEALKTMENAEGLKSALYASGALIDEATGGLKKHVTYLRNTATGALAELAERLESAYLDLKDLNREVDRAQEELDYDPKDMKLLEERVDALNSALHKHKAADLKALITLRDSYGERVDSISLGDEQLEALEKELKALETKALELAEKLSAARKAAAPKIETEVVKRLKLLGMQNVQFELNFKSNPLSISGLDSVTFLFSPNPGNPPQPISQIASGGEIARVMLVLKTLLAGAQTIIFDEVDTGTSGKVAEQMGKMMTQMNGQVLAITHLPQIAAQGKNHYKVEKTQSKNATRTSMRALTRDERISEIAQMLSGETISPEARKNAEALITQNS